MWCQIVPGENYMTKFLNKGTFLFPEYGFSLWEHYPPIQNFEVQSLVFPLNPKNFAAHSCPLLSKKIVPSASARWVEAMHVNSCGKQNKIYLASDQHYREVGIRVYIIIYNY